MSKKYIRTKTGKICKVEITKIDKEHNLFNDREKDMSYIDDDVIKIADGIEELCDEIVIENPNENPHLFYVLYDYGIKSRFDYVKERLEHFKDCVISGAIWTEWGLKYVAKMNEKGCLELI